MNAFVKGVTIGALLIATGCTGPAPAPPPTTNEEPMIDQRSYNLGNIGAFAEVVGVGVKKLALSPALTPEEMDALIEEAEKIVERNGAQCFLEKDFLVTDLFPEEVTAGKQVLFIYLDPVKDEYMALKAEKEALVAEGKYEGEARKEIARKMGRLLSYPEERIENMLSR
jgi:hypothetical protein